MSKKIPKGIRLNNPGNIERTGIKWQGLAAEQPDARFCCFTDPVYGIRAMVRILMTYNGRGTDTIREIISTWAPKQEKANPTESYIDFVASETLIGEDEPVDIDNPHDMIPILEAIVRFENGQQPYPYETFETAYYLATGKEKPCLTSLKYKTNSPPNSPRNSPISFLTALLKKLLEKRLN